MPPELTPEERPGRSRASGNSLGVLAPSEGVPRGVPQSAPATAPAGPRPPAMVDLTNTSPEGSRESGPDGGQHRNDTGACDDGGTGSGGSGYGGTDGGGTGSAGALSGGTRSDGDDTGIGRPGDGGVQRRLEFPIVLAAEGTGRASWDRVGHGLMQVDGSQERHKQPADRAATVCCGTAAAAAAAAPVSLCSSVSDGSQSDDGQSDGSQPGDEFRSPQLLHDRGGTVPLALMTTMPVTSQGRAISEPTEEIIDLT